MTVNQHINKSDIKSDNMQYCQKTVKFQLFLLLLFFDLPKMHVQLCWTVYVHKTICSDEVGKILFILFALTIVILTFPNRFCSKRTELFSFYCHIHRPNGRVNSVHFE